MGQEYFVVKNMVRRVQTRLQRAASPRRLRFKQFIGGKRLLRNQKMLLTRAQFKTSSKEILAGIKCGALEVTDPAGWVFFVGTNGVIYQRKGTEVNLYVEEQLECSVEANANNNILPSTPEIVPPAVKHENKIASVPIPAKEAKPNNLTELPGIGSGRARKLQASGITTFKQIADLSPTKLAKLLGGPTTEEQAAEICKAAAKK